MTYNINFLKRTKIEISDALHSLCPGATWSVEDTYDSIKNYYSDEYKFPTEEEITTEIERLQKIADSYQYQRDRASAYPSIQDQLDTLYHGGYDGWKATIDEVKNKYPKPENL
jgi:hypothetical protein